MQGKNEQRLRSLQRIYRAIEDWSLDDEAKPRVTSAVNPWAHLAIVGEAIGPRTVRFSGVNYFGVDGRLGKTGQYLDEMLRPLGYTVYPTTDVKLASGVVIPAALGLSRKTVYCTDLCPEFPGHATIEQNQSVKTSVKRPSQLRIKDALEHRFLERELAVVKPKVILLLGSHAYFAFYRHFLKRTELNSLQAVVEDMDSYVARYETSLVVPFLHPSPASPSFQRWFKVFKEEPMNSLFVRCMQPPLRC
jgi:uracil-DNA glycosylase